MTDTANLGLPCIDAAQAQKHVTHNEALRLLDTLVQLAALDRDLTAPPGSPSEGQRWIVKAGATGAWSGHDNAVAAWQDGAWQFSTPKVGWVAYVVDEGALIAWSGSGWVDALSMLASLQNMVLLGVGTAADGTNPFSAKLNSTLWVAKTVAEGGTGDLRYNLSKAAAANTLSLLLQDNYSGRAEIGLTGDDDFHFKVSADGSTWVEALAISRSGGGVRFLANETDVASAATCDIGSAANLKVQITGTTTITSFGTVHHCLRLIRFAAALTLTHNATSLVLPTGSNIVTAAGDCAIATSDASGNWRVREYQRADGTAVAIGAKQVTYAKIQDVAHGKMLGRLSASAGTVEECVIPFGQCRLTLSGSNLLLAPSEGNLLTINSVAETVPDAGVTLAPTGLSAGTTYYIYAYMNSGTMTLEASTTGHAAQTGTGIEIKSGDASRTLVGMARIITGPAWVDSVTQRLVASWFKRRTRDLYAASSGNTASASYVVLGTGPMIEFLTWNEAVIAHAHGDFVNTSNCQARVGIAVDSTSSVNAVNQSISDMPNTASIYNIHAHYLSSSLSEGYHYMNFCARTSAGTLTNENDGGLFCEVRI